MFPVRRRSTCRRFKYNLANANENSPLVAVDPIDPSKIVTVWVNNDTPDISWTPFTQVYIEGDYSIDGGKNWTPFFVNNEPFLIDPNSPPTSPYEYQQITNPSLDFDRNGNFYVLMEAHTGSTSGSLILQKYNFAAGSPVVQRFKLPTQGNSAADYNLIYQWLPNDDQAILPTMNVDANVPSFTDPTTGEVQTDLNSGNVYIAWNGFVVQPQALLPVIPGAL